jgi:hypothetical protein
LQFDRRSPLPHKSTLQELEHVLTQVLLQEKKKGGVAGEKGN